MELLSISISGLRSLEFRGRETETGICKAPITGVAHVSPDGIIGDRQADLDNHGGADKAVYAYSIENYQFWQHELGRDLPHGQFGENLTVSGMTDDAIHIGDRFRIGDTVEVEVTQPRVPCFKLGMRMQDNDFVARFHFSGRVGFYLRVLRAGDIQAGDAITRLHRDPGELNIRDAMLALNSNPKQQDIIRRALALPALSQAWRDSLHKKLK